jgi:glyoxylase-like metal-dependent hydrolase (beta-lactamase superfamily II)
MMKRFAPLTLAIALLGVACHEASRTPGELPTASPLSEGPTASPEPPIPPARPAATTLELQVVTGSPEGFLVNSTLVLGEKEAVLIDAQFTLPDAAKVAAAIAESGRTLTIVYVTHSHPDHYFGFPAIKEKFPKARLVALPQTVSMIEKTWEAKVKQWQPLYGNAVTSKPIVPEPLAGASLELDGQKLELVGGQQGDSADNSYVWIPSLRAVVTGDIVYDGVFPWTLETTAAERQTWRATLDKLAALGADVVVPGHSNVGRRGPNPASSERAQRRSGIEFTKEYLAAYEQMLASAKSAADLEARIKARYPDTALDAIVRIAAEAAFPAKPLKKKAPSAKAKP